MREFTSYGSLNRDLHYYAPRQNLIDFALTHLLGTNPEQGGHYITVWGPRQTGKTWLMQQMLHQLRTPEYQDSFLIAKVNLQHLTMQKDVNRIAQSIALEIIQKSRLDPAPVTRLDQLHTIFTKEFLSKPLILILDEVDALCEEAINGLTAVFRNIYFERQEQDDLSLSKKTYRLHSVALVGVRDVLGVENRSGSPFNVQRSLPIPNLTEDEVVKMFQWYQEDSGQVVEPDVVRQLYIETRGQPGLVGWFGELFTKTYNHDPTQPLTMANFEEVYVAALKILPNNNILNLISKAKHEDYQDFVLDLFRSQKTVAFEYDQPEINYLYLNGVIDLEKIAPTEYEVRFSSPFVQKRLFNYFSRRLFDYLGRLYDPFDDLEDTITDDELNIKALLRRYEGHLQANKTWLFKEVPRRKSDDRIYEAVYHFNLYMYLFQFLQSYDGYIYPEFPTGNGQIDLIIRYSNHTYGLEVKSFLNRREYQKALGQTAKYAQQLGLTEIWLAFFIEAIDKTNRQKYEVDYVDKEIKVKVRVVFLVIG